MCVLVFAFVIVLCLLLFVMLVVVLLLICVSNCLRVLLFCMCYCFVFFIFQCWFVCLHLLLLYVCSSFMFVIVFLYIYMCIYIYIYIYGELVSHIFTEMENQPPSNCHTAGRFVLSWVFCLVTSCFILKPNFPSRFRSLALPRVSPVWLSPPVPPDPHVLKVSSLSGAKVFRPCPCIQALCHSHGFPEYCLHLSCSCFLLESDFLFVMFLV